MTTETADTVPAASVPPRNSNRVRFAMGGIGGMAIGAWIIWYVVSGILGHGDRLTILETKTEKISEDVVEVKRAQQETLKAVSRIEGYIAKVRDDK